MALPSSGTITMPQIQAEFGGANPIGLNEYYRGGTYVPNWSGTSSIPTSGTISLNDFYGAGNIPTITNITNRTNGGVFTISGLSSAPKYIFVLIANFNSRQFGSVFPVPSITGIGSFTTIRAANYGSSNDGHRASIFNLNVGTATSVELNIATTSSLTVTVFALNNVTDLPVFSSGQANGATVTLNTPSQGFTVAASVRNFGTMSSASPSCDIVYAYAQGANGIDTAPPGGNKAYSLGNGTRYVTVAASFAF